MAFPPDTFEKRTVANRSGLTFDPDDPYRLYAEDYDAMCDELVAIEEYVNDEAAELVVQSNHQDGTVINGKIVPSVASNNLTVAIKTLSGADPSASNPVYVFINGVRRTISAALSVTKNAGTNWAGLGGTMHAGLTNDVFVYLGYNTTDGVTIGWSRIPWAFKYSNFSTTTTNTRYCAISTITNAASTDRYVNIGRFEVVLSGTAAFNFSIAADLNIVNAPCYETRWLDFTTSLSLGSTLSGYDLCKYKISYNEVKVNFSAYNRNMTGAGAAFYVQIPFTNASGLFGVSYALKAGANWVGANVYCDTNAGYIPVYKDYARTAWAGTENGNYIIITSNYPMI